MVTAQGMAADYKRLGQDRDVTFRRPRHACLACGDSGVIHNGDQLVNRLLFSDYDVLPCGQHRAGSDLPLICCCIAARSGTGPDGNNRSGFLDGGSALLNPRLGVLLDEQQRLLLHATRLAAWRQTERDMNLSRSLRAEGDADAAPGYISATREHCRDLARAQASIQPAPQGFHSLGACLATTVGGLSLAALQPSPAPQLPAAVDPAGS